MLLTARSQADWTTTLSCLAKNTGATERRWLGAFYGAESKSQRIQ